MGFPYYRIGWYLTRFTKQQCIREFVLHRHRLERPGPFVLACTHLAHVEPMLVATLLQREIRWMARIEFHRHWLMGPAIRRLGTFCVNRQGVPISAIRESDRLLADGEIVGIFPEGGCRKGTELAFRGGRIRQGVATVAMRAQVPIVPVVVLGTDRLTDPDAWLPGKYGRTYVAVGEAIIPPPWPARTQWRRHRHALAARVEAAFVGSYKELLARSGLRDSDVS
jgi:1-acyl-sn-glycerol-3-phosphate acyltransferase